MTKRLIIVLVLLMAGFCSIYALPKSASIRPTALPGELKFGDGPYELPHLIGYWSGGRALKPSEEEISILAEDTDFTKKRYLRNNTSVIPRDLGPNASEFERLVAQTTYEEVEVSIVTSGSDMGNSIHRPERCLVAQGFNIGGEKKLVLKVRGKDLPVKKLTTTQHIKDPGSERIFHYSNVTYYWFVGHDALTNDHYQRTFLDMKDRLFRGYDQQWAYATVGMMVEPHRAENDEGRAHPKLPFVERFVAAEDRTPLLAELEPNTDEYFFCAAFDLQTRKEAANKISEIDALFKKWEEVNSASPLLSESRRRQKLLVDGARITSSLDYLQRWLAPYPHVLTRMVDNTTVDENGLTEADRILQEFIVDLAKEIIDRKMIKAWNAPAT